MKYEIRKAENQILTRTLIIYCITRALDFTKQQSKIIIKFVLGYMLKNGKRAKIVKLRIILLKEKHEIILLTNNIHKAVFIQQNFILITI